MLDAEALWPAEEAGVVRVRPDSCVEFAHPLLASAVYEAARPSRLRSLHAELADRVSDPEERARHMTRAFDGPDDGLARALETAAALARRRGAVEVAAELLEESARRTVEVGLSMSERRLASARLHLSSGDSRRAEALGREVLEHDPPGAMRASALHVLSEVAAMGADMPSAKDLLEEAIAVADDDPAQVAELELALATVLGALLDPLAGVSHAERAVELARASRLAGLEAEALALGACLGVMIGRGLDEGQIDRALELEDVERDAPFQQRPSLYAAISLEFVGTLERSQTLLRGLHERLRARGEEGELAYVLVHLAVTSMLTGDLGAAEEWATEARRTASMTGTEIFVSFALLLRLDPGGPRRLRRRHRRRRGSTGDRHERRVARGRVPGKLGAGPRGDVCAATRQRRSS